MSGEDAPRRSLPARVFLSARSSRRSLLEALRRRSPEAQTTLAISCVLGVGLVVDLLGGAVVALPPAPAADRLVSRSVFCPPALRGGQARMALAVGGGPDSSTRVGIEPAEDGKLDVPADGILFYEVGEALPLDVAGYGATTRASAVARFVSPIPGAGAAACADEAAARWYFAEGSSTLGSDERLVVYNPFPSEAVVRITFYTPSGEKAPANLLDQPVPARSSVGFAVNDFLLRQRVLGATVTAIRGRVVAWRALLARPEGRPRGGQFTLGAIAPAMSWYFPEGGVGSGFDERISVLNPTREEAIITISLAGNDDSVQPPRLVEVKVPPRSTKSWSLAEEVGGKQADLGGASAIVRSLNGVGVVAERTVWYSTKDLTGVASEIGATGTASRWWAGPAAAVPTTDSLVVLNPSTEEALVSVTLLRPGGRPLSPPELQDVRARAFSRLRITLAAITRGRPMVALVSSTEPIVVERVSYSSAASDIASVMATPLDRID